MTQAARRRAASQAEARKEAGVLRALAKAVERTGEPLRESLADQLARELEDRIDAQAVRVFRNDPAPDLVAWEKVRSKRPRRA